MKFSITVVALLVTAILTQTAAAEWQWQRFRTNRGYSYKRVFVQNQAVQQKVKNQTTVINNLVGIPVPVSYTEPITAQGSTVYGYSAVAQSYGQVDLGLLYNQAARLTDQAQQLAGQAHTDFATLVQAEAQNRADVARIVAQGQAAREALQAVQNQPQPQVVPRSFAFQVVQDEKGNLRVEPIQDGEEPDFGLVSESSPEEFVSNLIQNKCVSCHNSEVSRGGLDLTGEVSQYHQEAILETVTTEDDARRMPRNKDGSAGQLSDYEIEMLKKVLGH